MGWLVAQLFAPLSGVIAFVGDHRWGALALVALAASVAARVYLAPEGTGISKLMFWAAIGLACFDWGYSHRAAIDRDAWARAEAARLHAALIEHARREDEIAKARAAADAEARAEARQEADREIRRKESEDASHAHDRGSCLDADSVLRLQRLGR